jgi:NTP pyrophosphatase (non-canonical NTP hydrolase)
VVAPNSQNPPVRGLVVLVTSPRVAPGLLTAQAWDLLRAAATVMTGSPDHPQLAALDQAGISFEVAPAEPVGDRARRLARLGRAASAPVVWLAAQCRPGATPSFPEGTPVPPTALAAPPGDTPDPDGQAKTGDGELIAALAAAETPVTVLEGSCDLPGSRLLDLVTAMDVLRVHCPWDAKQTHRSLAPYLIEESYEALEALETGDERALRDELGDVLLQVVFHARIAAERRDGSGFTIDDVADGIVSKLVRRHPHVFGDVRVSGAEEVKTNWAAIKAAEREAACGAPASVLDGVPFGQPALSLAAQLQGRASGAGVPDEVADLGEDLGSQMFALVAAARAAGLDPELELRSAARRFRDRVHAWESSGGA